MPLQQDSAQQFGELLCVESEDAWMVSEASVRLTEAGLTAAHETLRQHGDVAAVLVVQVGDLLANVFVETWEALPQRLASMAIRPPVATCLVARPTDALRRAVQVSGDTNHSALWRCLVELAKGSPRIGLNVGSSERTLLELNATDVVDGDLWLPELLTSPPRHELDWLFAELRLARLSDLCGHAISSADATAVLAGLWLLHGDGDASHRQSQSIEDEGRHRCGNFWHAIMHRQEPDYGNSKYWSRRVGQPEFLAELARRADELIAADGSDASRRWRVKLGLPSRWDSFAFVDWCEAAAREADKSQIGLVRRLQFIEMHLLLRASYADATRP
ncbi:MAG: hypothetical protein IAG10_08920 [Planctomycetaceae bacterium]|nr:hypothetical protein [Planctomycetaceae bacterium]